ncbi:MAG TPA: HAD-IIIA family hydrolase [Planctomycetota bacterium]|nr:HAD-IIIA family hydrolase [Planctomycetota bacterium]
MRGSAGTGSGTSDGTTALVLAGGLGTRLRPCVADRPKVLADVGGEPFLARVLDQIAAAGVTRTVLCTGWLGDQVERVFGASFAGMPLVHARERQPLGTAGALRAALPLVTGDDVLVLNGDSFCAAALPAFVSWARARRAPAALVAAAVEDASRFGTLHLEGRTVRGFVEKAPGRARAWISAGIYRFTRAVLAELPDTAPLSLERDVLPRLAADGRLLAWRTAAPFLDVGTPESYAAAPAFFAARPPRAGLLVLDRDGTLIEDHPYLGDPDRVVLLPGVVDGLRRFAARGWRFAIVTNQSGIGRGFFDERVLHAVHGELLDRLARDGIHVDAVVHCPHRPDEGCACRKPAPALLERVRADLGYAAHECLVVGDKACDVDLGRRAGARTVLVRTGCGAATEREGACVPDLVVDDLAALAAQEIGA